MGMNSHRVTLLVTLDVETVRSAGGVGYALRNSKPLRESVENFVALEMTLPSARVFGKAKMKKLKVTVS